MLDANRLRTFRSVVATGSIQAAADQLRLTPSAVSQQMSALQRDLGLLLLERVGRGVRPTPAGMRIAVASGESLRALNRLESLVRDLREGRTGHLTIGHFASAGLAWMPTIVKSLRAEFPELMVELVLNDVPGGAPLTLPDIDLRIAVAGENVPPGFSSYPIVEDPFVMVVHRDHPLAGSDPVPLADFRDAEFVANDFAGSPVSAIQSQAFAAAGFSPRYIVQAADHISALAFVAEGIGVTMLPVLATADLPEEVALVTLFDPVPVRQIYALVRDAISAAPATQRVMELLRRHPNPA